MDFIWDNLFKGRQENTSLTDSLKANMLFQDFNFFELKLLENIVNVRKYRTGESIFRQGDVGVGMYIIMSGSVNIYVEELQANSGELKTTHITQLKTGDFFGELALVEEEGRRSASASAQTDCELAGFFKPDLIEVINRNPTAGVKILKRLGEVLGIRLRQTTSKITEMKKVDPLT
jgi:CRP/FNR family cyclic AMP-dependent transcriptional regulator